MPCALRACATSLSRPAQPPSPDMTMAKLSVGGVPGARGYLDDRQIAQRDGRRRGEPGRSALHQGIESGGRSSAAGRRPALSCPSPRQPARAAPCMCGDEFASRGRRRTRCRVRPEAEPRDSRAFSRAENANPPAGERRVEFDARALAERLVADRWTGENPTRERARKGVGGRLHQASRRRGGAPAP